MKNVLFVCLGNICRSAMAEGILIDRAKQEGIAISVDSAGTSNYHIDESPDNRMQQKAIDHGLDISYQRGRQFVVDDFDAFDYIFAMDESNKKNILALARSEEDKKKVTLYLEDYHPYENVNVPDPYYGGAQGFEDVYQMLAIACDNFIKKIKK
ncbi:low molecular weight phosphotyrosine protein phosphatase [Vicingaceae bacterium]|nr:low molecular weight phosphotyrosine protein phosphatase [Vicingaceae bacterium]